MAVTHVLGPKRHSEKKDDVFECGIPAVGNARVPFSVRFFLLAIIFVLFDVEIIFLYPYVVNLKALGWQGLGEVACFSGLVLIGFVYLLKNNVLEFEK